MAAADGRNVPDPYHLAGPDGGLRCSVAYVVWDLQLNCRRRPTINRTVVHCRLVGTEAAV